MIRDRYLHRALTNDLEKKMVFIGGPRQVGKTTLAKQIGKENYRDFIYFNWDSREDRKKILEGKVGADARLVIYDEIHKYKQWKNYIKGEYDTHKEDFNIIVTGSARLDLYRKGGDSLQGRYHYYRLHPFSVRELAEAAVKIEPAAEPDFLLAEKRLAGMFNNLFSYGGFPEPLFARDDKTLRRFHNERLDRLVKEDIREIELLRDLSAIQILVELLPERVGSLLSLNSLREDLQVTHKTISFWMEVLERFYYHFRIYPYATSIIKSLRKEPKMYLWDWSQVENDGNRLENMVASHLLKFAHFLHDAHGLKAELNFLRDIEGREVDFLISINKKPWFAVEVKLADEEIDKSLNYFSGKLKIPFVYQVVKTGKVDFRKGKVRVISADKFLSGLV